MSFKPGDIAYEIVGRNGKAELRTHRVEWSDYMLVGLEQGHMRPHGELAHSVEEAVNMAWARIRDREARYRDTIAAERGALEKLVNGIGKKVAP